MRSQHPRHTTPQRYAPRAAVRLGVGGAGGSPGGGGAACGDPEARYEAPPAEAARGEARPKGGRVPNSGRRWAAGGWVRW